ERAVEQRLVPHQRAESDVAASIYSLNSELDTDSLVAVRNGQRERARVVILRGGKAILVQIADAGPEARIRTAARDAKLRVGNWAVTQQLLLPVGVDASGEVRAHLRIERELVARRWIRHVGGAGSLRLCVTAVSVRFAPEVCELLPVHHRPLPADLRNAV